MKKPAFTKFAFPILSFCLATAPLAQANAQPTDPNNTRLLFSSAHKGKTVVELSDGKTFWFAECDSTNVLQKDLQIQVVDPAQCRKLTKLGVDIPNDQQTVYRFNTYFQSQFEREGTAIAKSRAGVSLYAGVSVFLAGATVGFIAGVVAFANSPSSEEGWIKATSLSGGLGLAALLATAVHSWNKENRIEKAFRKLNPLEGTVLPQDKATQAEIDRFYDALVNSIQISVDNFDGGVI